MFPILHIGPLAVQFPGLLLLAGVWVGTYFIDREAPRYKLSAGTLNNMVFFSLIAGIVGARLGYALRFLNVYLENPLDVFSLNTNTLSALDGVVAAVLVGIIYGYRKKLPLWPTLDALTPALAVLAIALGAAHLASGDAFGAPTSLPWAIELWGAQRHPSQVYEVVLAVLILLAVLWLRERSPFSGFVFLSWVALTAVARLVLEAFRGDSLIMFDALRQAQLLSLFVLVAALIGLHLRARNENQKAGRASK